MKSKLFTIAPVTLAAVGLLAVTAPKANAGFALTGNYLNVGVGADGSIVNQTGGYESYAPSNYVGIQYDGSGTGNYAVNNDFITPGSPFQMYSIGVDGNYGFASYEGGDYNLSATTVSTGALSTKTTGSTDGLDYVQTLSFGLNSTVINFSVTLTNNTDATLTDVAYATGFDPDPDVYQHSSYFTNNVIVSPGVVEATGPDTGNSIFIQDTTGGAAASIIGDWPVYDPYQLSSSSENDGDGDYAIFDGWSIGDLAAGASVTITYNYIINATPVSVGGSVPTGGAPDLAATWALLGMGLAGLGAVRRKLKI